MTHDDALAENDPFTTMQNADDYLDPFSVEAATDDAEARPSRFVFYGPHGIGKTALAARFPNPIIAFTEHGKRNIRVRSFPQVITKADEMNRAIGGLLRGKHDRTTFVVDSLDWFEPIVWAETCARNNIGTIEEPGYGKGYLMADEVWSEFLSGMDALNEAGMHVVLLAHSDVTSFSPPESDKYDRYDIALHKRARAMLHEWADVVGFCYEKTYVKSIEEGSGKHKKITYKGGGSGGRILALERRSTWEAKNGYGLPAEIPLTDSDETATQLLAMIDESFLVGR